MTTEDERTWCRIEVDDLAEGEVTSVVAEGRRLCVSRGPDGIGVLDDRCPHQGGPLADGEIGEEGWLLCPWHGYEYDPCTGTPPPGFTDAATAYPVEERADGTWVALPRLEARRTVMDQMVDVLCDWGLDTVFGMVGHSNLGMAEALRTAEADGRLRYVGIRHEGAAAFAASGYAKLTGRPAACFSIAGPGATNLLTGLWDAKVDRAPIIALTGQVQTQVLGPGAFQELPLTEAFGAVAAWSQTVLSADNASELAALAYKHALVERDVAHLVLPDDRQDLPALAEPPATPKEGRVAPAAIAPPADDLERAIDLLAGAERPVIIVGSGARRDRAAVLALAERIDAPIITTFKAKGAVADAHPLAASVLGRSGTPIGAATMAGADALLVLGASFSNHTGIARWVPTIHVDADRMALGRFHAVEVPLWGDIGRTVAALHERLEPVDRPVVRADLERRWASWRAEKARRAARVDPQGRMHPAAVFGPMSSLVPDDAVLAVDVGNNTYTFGHYFECGAQQDVLMSGYLGSIGFGFPAAMGAWAAVGDTRPVVSVSGDGGFGQYLAEMTTAVKHEMPITHVLLNNDELGKISREQVAAIHPVWQTGLVNPDFAAYAELCGARGWRVEDPADVGAAIAEALAVTDGPSLVEIVVSARDT